MAMAAGSAAGAAGSRYRARAKIPPLGYLAQDRRALLFQLGQRLGHNVSSNGVYLILGFEEREIGTVLTNPLSLME